MIKSLYPCFQHWSAKGSVYIISDTHFFDEDREYMGYDFSEEVQIGRLKERCHKNDTLIHLGDVGDPELMRILKCHKVLIMGNHDQSIEKMQKYFDEVYAGPLWISNKIVLSHEPIDLKTWDTMQTIAFNIHGHKHNGNTQLDDFHLNLAQNIFGYLPLNLKNFIESGVLKEIQDVHRVTINLATLRSENFAKDLKDEILKQWYLDTGVENV